MLVLIVLISILIIYMALPLSNRITTTNGDSTNDIIIYYEQHRYYLGDEILQVEYDHYYFGGFAADGYFIINVIKWEDASATGGFDMSLPLWDDGSQIFHLRNEKFQVMGCNKKEGWIDLAKEER